MALHLVKTIPGGNKLGKARKILEPLIFLTVLLLFFGYMGSKMGLDNMMNTMMQTAFKLLTKTVFYLMGITVLMGAFARLLSEFGVVALLEKLLRPLMKPLFNLPGVAALGAVVTFLSDNPAIISLSKDGKFARYFKTYQLVSLTNFGTAWGMGLVVLVVMMTSGYGDAALVGLLGAGVGCLISTRLMQRFTLKKHPEYDTMVMEVTPIADDKHEGDAETATLTDKSDNFAIETSRTEQRQGIFMRVLDAALEGGKQGVGLGMAIIPGVLIISTLVMMLTNTVAGIPEAGVAPLTEYNGSAFQGVGLLPAIADKVDWLFEALFGFDSAQLIAFPLTALGAVGAALGLVPTMEAQGILNGNAVAVFTAIGMCWSGYLSTHAAMLDSLGFRHLISKAILAHTIAGLCAGVVAHWLYVLITWIGA